MGFMLYRPNYCSNCGEKVVRAEWRVWTSRRFCDVCVTENPAAEYAPKVAIALAVLSIAAGGTAYFRAGSAPEELPRADRRLERPATFAALASTPVPQSTALEETAKPQNVAPDAVTIKQPIVVEQAYVCGAMTKKGTACSRRVKGNVRCFQHQGMPTAAEFAKQ